MLYLYLFATLISIAFIFPLVLWFVRNVRRSFWGYESNNLNRWVIKSVIYGWLIGLLLIAVVALLIIYKVI